MLKAEAITALVLTYNEQDNIARTLDSIAWAKRILIIDSGSTDNTLAIISRYPAAEVLHREFTTHADQWNFGLKNVKTKWVLTLDADYQFPQEMREYLQRRSPDSADGYYARFEYYVHGKPVRGTILPPRMVLFKTALGRYVDDGHTQALILRGVADYLPFRIIHDDRKPLSRWIRSQLNYAALEESKLAQSAMHDLSLQDKIRKWVVVAPPAVFVLVYLLKGGFLSGWRGLFYALQRLLAELILSLYLLERKLRP